MDSRHFDSNIRFDVASDSFACTSRREIVVRQSIVRKTVGSDFHSNMNLLVRNAGWKVRRWTDYYVIASEITRNLNGSFWTRKFDNGNRWASRGGGKALVMGLAASSQSVALTYNIRYIIVPPHKPSSNVQDSSQRGIFFKVQQCMFISYSFLKSHVNRSLLFLVLVSFNSVLISWSSLWIPPTSRHRST